MSPSRVSVFLVAAAVAPLATALSVGGVAGPHVAARAAAPAVRPVSMVAEGVAKGTAADTDCAVDDVDCSIEDLLERNRQYRQAPFKKLMAANRAEIAVRIERAARELNMQTAAIYGIEDAKSQHRWGADQSFLLEKADPNQPAVAAYLDIEQIVKVAKENGVDAIHPGYGFLSENPDFAKACEREGIKFVGPTVDNLITFADKTSARIAAIEANVPVVPGTDESLTDFADVKAFVDTNGLPIIIKAAMGGGGKGMRVVREMSDLQPFFESAQSEAKARIAPVPPSRPPAPRRRVGYPPACARPPAAPSPPSPRRPFSRRPPSATAPSSSSRSSRTRATSRCRSSATARAAPSTCGSATARCSAATKRWSRSRRRGTCRRRSARRSSRTRSG